MKSFIKIITVILVLLLISGLVAVLFVELPKLEETIKPIEDGAVSDNGTDTPDDGGSTSPGGETNNNGDTQCAHEYEWDAKTVETTSAFDLSTGTGAEETYAQKFFGEDFVQGYVFGLDLDDDSELDICFAMISKESDPDTQKWYFTTFDIGYLMDSSANIQTKILYYSEQGFESVEFKISTTVKILGIRYDGYQSPSVSHGPGVNLYTITYAVRGDTCTKCGEKA